MNHKMYCVVSGVVFLLVALTHLTRLVYGWHIQIENTIIPMWASWIGFILTAVLSTWAFYVSSRIV